MTADTGPYREGEKPTLRLPAHDNSSTMDGTPELLTLREGQEYRYDFCGSDAITSMEPSELFYKDSDSPDGCRGYFRPGNHVGDICVEVALRHDQPKKILRIQVTSHKLDYETEYREMLSAIAKHAVEGLLQGFSPSTLKVTPGNDGATRLSYTSLALVIAHLKTSEFQAAIGVIQERPHREWVAYQQERRIEQGGASGRDLLRALRRDPRISAPPHLANVGLTLLPRRFYSTRSESTYDTVPNRFIKAVFTEWRQWAVEMRNRLKSKEGPSGGNGNSGPVRRGALEMSWLVEFCDEFLHHPIFQEVGTMERLPSGNHVLEGRDGYQEVTRTFAIARATISLALSVELPDDAFSATQRNVATLYEYWCYFFMRECISNITHDRICEDGNGAPSEPLFKATSTGLSLALKQGENSLWSRSIYWEGRRLDIELWFNRTFTGRSCRTDSIDSADGGSWTEEMRPDITLCIRRTDLEAEATGGSSRRHFFHFDAKYSIVRAASESTTADHIGSGAGSEDVGSPSPSAREALAVRSEYLLKMHAYRDAIRSSIGAYVLFPGTEACRYSSKGSLPRIGAFPLRPASSAGAGGREELYTLLREIIDWVATA